MRDEGLLQQFDLNPPCLDLRPVDIPDGGAGERTEHSVGFRGGEVGNAGWIVRPRCESGVH